MKTKDKVPALAKARLEPPPRTGWAAGMMQDDNRDLSRWLSNTPNARQEAREAIAQPVQPAFDVEAIIKKIGIKVAEVADFHADTSQVMALVEREIVASYEAGRAEAVAVPLTDDVMNDVVRAYVAAGKRGLDLLGALKCAVEAAHAIRRKQ